MASQWQPSQLGEQLNEWASLTVVRALNGHARAVEIAAWVKALPPDVTTAWVTARGTPNEFESFDAWLSDALLVAGTAPTALASGALGGFDELEHLLSRSESRGRVLLVVDNFDEIRDEQVLGRLTRLLGLNEHLHLLVRCRGAHPIESMAPEGIEVKVIRTRARPSGGDIAGALVPLLDHPWSERVRDDVLAWLATATEEEASERAPQGAQTAQRRRPSGSPRGSEARQASAPRPPRTATEPSSPALAFSEAASSQDWEAVDRLWFGSVAAMLSDDPVLLQETLENLPTDLVRANPTMEVLREALQTAATDDDGSKTATARAFADICARLVTSRWASMSLNELLVVGTGALIQLRMVGRLEDSEALGDRLSARSAALGATQQAARGRLGLFHLHRGITFTLLGDDANAVRSYNRAWEQAIGGHVDFVRSHAAANMALTYALRGETAQARRWLQRHHSLDTRRWPGHDRLSVAGHLAAAILALDRLDTTEAREQLGHLSDHAASSELWPFIALLHARLAIHIGTARQALIQVERLRTVRDRDLVARGAASALVTRAQADLFIATGQGERAQELIERARRGSGLHSLPAARLRVLGGQIESGRYVDRLTWDPATSTRDRLEMLLIGALAGLRRRDERTASRLVNQAVEIYGETGILSAFASIPLQDLNRLMELADQSLGPGDLAVLAQQPPMYPAHLVLVSLSEREQAVLHALATTASRQSIADSLFVSVNTVKTQLASIYGKLGATSRATALRKAVEHGLLTDEDGRQAGPVP